MRASDGPPTGWIAQDGVLKPADQVAAYGARGQAVTGICNTRDCRRRIQLEPKDLAGQGMGLLSMTKVQRLYRCQRLDHCSLDFHAGPMANPLEVGDFVGRPNVRVRLRCQGNGCSFFRVWIVEQMIAGLERAGKGNARTRLDELGKLMTAACPTCKKVSWVADVLWANVDTLGWRARGEAVFADMEVGSRV